MSIWIISLVFHFSYVAGVLPLIFHPNSQLLHPRGVQEACISTNPSCSLEILPEGFYTSSTSCPSSSNGLIFFLEEFIINGTSPYYFDWDDLSTPLNDDFNDDGLASIDSLPAGTYALIITDALGCTNSALTVVEDPVISVSTIIDSVGLCDFTGGIQFVLYTGPPGLLNYNWDFAFTPEDDDFGSGMYGMGFPPAQNDQEDLMEGLEGGTYFLELTLVYDSTYQDINCVWRDTFNIFIDSLRLICPAGDARVYAGVADNMTTYQWQIDSLNGFEDVYADAHHSGTSDPILHLIDMPSSWYGHQYRCKLTKGMDITYSDPFTLRFGTCSDGSYHIWGSPLSWDCNIVPDIYTDVFVTNHGSTFLILANAFCRSLTLLPGSKLRIIPPALLTVDEEP